MDVCLRAPSSVDLSPPRIRRRAILLQRSIELGFPFLEEALHTLFTVAVNKLDGPALTQQLATARRETYLELNI
jgi:hypothetical protein